MATLSLELIDKIFLANPNKIISTYLAFSKDNNIITGNSKSSDNALKRRKLSNSNNKDKQDIKGDKDTIKYLLNQDTYMKYSQQSSWLKYFIHSQPLKKQNKRNQPKSKLKSNIEESINTIATYFNQIETYYKQQHCTDDNSLLALITRFETLLDTGSFESDKFEKHLEALKKYYVYNYEIPTFVKLILILYYCGYFESSKSISKPGIHIFLNMILEGEPSKIADFIKTYKHYSAIYKFIPLFGIYLGMGYSFVIGWDTKFDCMIGFTENGSDGHEVMYNIGCAMKYFNTPSRLVKIDKKQLLEDYLKMICKNDISILLDCSRRLNVCDMPYANVW